MKNSSKSATSLTLLGRLRDDPNDANSWREFETRYGNMIYRWCLGWNLQPADAADVTQDVMVALVRQMKDFEYDHSGRFRSWLKTIAYRAWCDFLASRKRRANARGGDEAITILDSVAIRDDFLRNLERECEQNLLDDAMSLVEQRVEPTTWHAFVRTAIENQKPKVVAADLEIPVGTVYVHKFRVQKLIQKEVELLEQF